MDGKIEPALTPESLAQQIEYWRDLGHDAKRRGATEEMHEYYGRMFGLREAANVLGFTSWEDVDALNAAAEAIEREVRAGHARSMVQAPAPGPFGSLGDRLRGLPRRASRLRSTAQRIAALLPPRSDTHTKTHSQRTASAPEAVQPQ